MSTNRYRGLGCLLVMATLASGQAQAQAVRPTIERLDQLPARTYSIPPDADRFFASDPAWMSLAAQFRRDLTSDLTTFTFRDRGLHLQYLWRVFVLHLAAAQLDSATASLDELLRVRTASGLPASDVAFDVALLAARKAAPGRSRAALAEALRQHIADMTPADIFRTFSTQRLGLMTERDSARTRESVAAVVRRATGGMLAGRDAFSLINDWYDRELLAFQPVLLGAVTDLLRENPRALVDMWPARTLSLETAQALTPVTIAVWDAGVDTTVLRGRLYVNPREVSGNGIDDDRNGFVDDVHGAGFESGQRTTVLLEPPPYDKARIDSIALWTRGQRDIVNLVDSPDAQALVRLFHTLSTDALAEFRRSVVQVVVYYGHGTQIASIAVEGNPAARLLPLIQREWRQTNDSSFITLERARAIGQTYLASVAYMRQQGVRVVNASWGMAQRDFERETRRLMPRAMPDEQRERARQLMTIHAEALVAALTSAPDILFVFTAGNEGVDIRQTGRIPASLDLPNLITVGGADLSGDEATFTSFGKIDVYANAVERRAQFPGGQVGVVSAGSLAAPDVANLAGKLWALYPGATVADVRASIINGADERTSSAGRPMRVLNPLTSLELLRRQQGK